jgi:cytochrome c-type biogenesis protein CcmF
VGPLLAWRRSTLANLRSQFLWPLLGGVATGAGVVALGVPFWASGLCFALCAFVTVTILQEFVRGAQVRRQATGADLFTSLVGLFARSRRRYGGYVVHLGIVLIFLGFAGNGFKREEQVKLTPGQQVVVAPYVVHYKTISVTDDGRKQMVTAHVEAQKDGKSLGQMYPARWFYRGREEEATTEVALRRSFADDLYVNLAGYELQQMIAILQVTVNTLVNWIWFGVGIMILGTGICLLPERTFAFATKSVPQGAVTTSLILLMVYSGGLAHLHAQHVELPQTVAVVPRSQTEKNLQTELVCMCGTCGRKRIGECTCSMAAQMREEVARLVGEGMSQDQIVAHFVTKYGSQEVLSRPIDRGFNRLAWFLPYAIGGLGFVVIGRIAWRWSRRRDADAADAPAPAGTPARSELENRLDDELRDLD